MRKIKLSWLLAGVLGAAMVATLYAQEAQNFTRGINILTGNLVLSQGYVHLGSRIIRDYRPNTSITAEAATTYTAAQVLAGYITRDLAITARTDVLPTAVDLAAAMPNVGAGTSFWFIVDRGTSGAAMTLNGTSTGVTYATGCGTAVGTGDTMFVLISFTSTTAYRAVCVNPNT